MSADPSKLHTPEDKPDITPRDLHFEFDPALPRDWHSGEPGISRFYDALSLSFPEGERFFIDSVRHFVPQIDDPALKAQAKGFAAQEAIHSREHVSYNAHLRRHDIDTRALERTIKWGLSVVRKWLPQKGQLAITCALEHYTALFAALILSDPQTMNGAHPFYADLWRWHAVEEDEHKSVAFDVYQTVAPGWPGYLRRIGVMTWTTLEFNFFIALATTILMAKSGELTNGRAWARTLNYLFGRPGVWRRLMAGVAVYYKPSFHPTQHHPGLSQTWRDRLSAQTNRTIENGGTLFQSEVQ